MKFPWKVFKTTLLLLLLSHSLASVPSEDQPGDSYSHGQSCLGCVVLVSVIEQLAEVHNSSVQVAMERLCSYLPGKFARALVLGLLVSSSVNHQEGDF